MRLSRRVAQTAIEQVVAAVTDQGIVQAVARTVQVRTAQQGQPFNVGAEAVADAGLDRVVSGPAGFHHQVARIVDHVKVIPF